MSKPAISYELQGLLVAAASGAFMAALITSIIWWLAT